MHGKKRMSESLIKIQLKYIWHTKRGDAVEKLTLCGKILN